MVELVVTGSRAKQPNDSRISGVTLIDIRNRPAIPVQLVGQADEVGAGEQRLAAVAFAAHNH
jgi:hypothetical protein